MQPNEDQYKSPDDRQTSEYFREKDENYLISFFGNYNDDFMNHAEKIMHEACDVITYGYPTMLNNEFFNDQCLSYKKMNFETGEYLPDEGWGWIVTAGKNGITQMAVQNMTVLNHITSRTKFIQRQLPNPQDEDAKETMKLLKSLDCSSFVEFGARMSFTLFSYKKKKVKLLFFIIFVQLFFQNI